MRFRWLPLVLCQGCSSPPLERPAVPVSIQAAPLREAEEAPRPAQKSKQEDTPPAEPFSAAWSDASAQNAEAPPVRMLSENSGACLEPIEAAYLTEPYATFVRDALGLPDPQVVAAMIVTPSFRPPWMLSIRRTARGRRVVRVTRLDRDVWAAMLKRMQELQGPSVSLAEQEQRRGLAGVTVHPSAIEQSLDRRTADLFAQLWQALVDRAQVVETDFATCDGTEYEFWTAGRAGTIVSPDGGTILGLATSAAQHLARVVEAPDAADSQAIRFIQEDLQEALVRTRNRQPCARTVER